MNSNTEPKQPFLKECLVCSSGLGTRVNEALRAGTSVRDISTDTGISKSAIGRHRIKCWGEVEKLPNTKGKTKKATQTASRQTKYIAALEDEVKKGRVEVSEENGRFEVSVPGFGLVKCPIRDTDDLVGHQYEGLKRVWKVLDEASRQYEADPTPGKAKIVLAAFHEWNTGLMSIGKVKGIVIEGQQTTNQTLNVYAQLDDKQLAEKGAQLRELIALAKAAQQENPPEVVEGEVHESI